MRKTLLRGTVMKSSLESSLKQVLFVLGNTNIYEFYKSMVKKHNRLSVFRKTQQIDLDQIGTNYFDDWSRDQSRTSGLDVTNTEQVHDNNKKYAYDKSDCIH